jgi:hypothetical protein
MLSNILYSAGVLFFSKGTDKTPLFLLGKDYDNKWSNFGGRCEISDKFEIENTAARECWEESVGSILDFDSIKHKLKVKNVKVIISKTPKGHPYYMFLIKIPLNYSYRERFISTKKFLSNIDVDKKFLEMYDIKWVSLDTILNSIDNKRPLIKLRNVFEQTLVSNIKDIEKYLNEN